MFIDFYLNTFFMNLINIININFYYHTRIYVNFCYSLNSMSGGFFTKNIVFMHIFMLYMSFLSLKYYGAHMTGVISALLGSFWAVSSFSWGRWWSADTMEILIIYFFTFACIQFHNVGVLNVFYYYGLLVFCYMYLNRFSFLTSKHLFLNLSLDKYYYVYLIHFNMYNMFLVMSNTYISHFLFFFNFMFYILYFLIPILYIILKYNLIMHLFFYFFTNVIINMKLLYVLKVILYYIALF